MSRILHIKSIQMAFIIFIIYTLKGFAQTTNITGEEEFFFKRPEKSNINLGVDLLFTQTSQYYSKVIYSTIEDEMFQVGFSLRGYFPFLRRFSARFHIPYLYKAGIEEEDKYPNAAEVFPGLSDFRKNYGFGDISTDISYAILSRPFNLVTQLGAVVATGESRFHSTYDGFLPLGNGFQALSIGGGISRRLSFNTLLFASGGYVFRFPRDFEPTEYNDGLILDGKKYDPDDIYFFRAGLGFRLRIFSRQSQFVNLETEYISVGNIKLNDSHFNELNEQPVVESAFVVTRIGIKLIARREKGISTSLFLGVENRKYDGNRSLLPIDRDSNTFLVIATLPMMIKFLNFNF
ncbi:MAG: hypothetical protein JSW07_14110 [bacterium]|nr:MAG: hypothetical protein JSW07_14110 [bacterium]